MTESERDELLIQTATIVKSLDRRLFGNGHPGELEKIRQEALEKYEEVRITAQKLQNWKNGIQGAFAVLTAIISIIGTFLFKHLLQSVGK